MFIDKKVIDPHAIGLQVHKIGKNEATCWCPFHDDVTPSATFNIVKGLFHCFGCGVAMNAARLANELDGEIVKVDSLVPTAYDPKERSSAWRILLGSALAYDNEYLESRGVTESQVTKHKILHYPGGIIFPLANVHSMITGVQVRRYAGKPKYMFYGERTPLWPLEQLQSEPPLAPIILVEGIFGALRAEASGVSGVYATLSVSAIESALPLLLGREVVTAFDDDDAGLLASAKMVMHGMPAIWPPIEADELSHEEWRKLTSPIKANGDLFEVAQRHSNPKSVIRSLQKDRKVWYNDSGYSPIQRSS